jgi:hypothetical protein
VAVQYQRVRWLHDHVDRPVQMYGEIDDDGRAVRKVDEFRDGHMTWSADPTGERLPDLIEIATRDDLVGELISRREFEEIWARARVDDPDALDETDPDDFDDLN